MKFIDCFIFYNELDLLEYRLELLYNYVDLFIIIEANKTFTGKDKPIYFKDNHQRFAKYLDKIVYIIDESLKADAVHNIKNIYDKTDKQNDEVWQNEIHQRNYIDEGLQKLGTYIKGYDYIIISDVDEIINPNIIKYFQENNINIPFLDIQQDFYYYNLTCKNSKIWTYAKLITYDHYRHKMNSTPQDCRMSNAANFVQNGGWHLSYFCSAKLIKNKIENFSHQEFNKPEYTDEKIIEYKINCKKDLFLRESETWTYIPIEKNENLPPLYNIYLKNYI